jgi:outer membrane autotransporter protein
VSISVGASYGRDLSPGRFTLGLFAEFGNGDYDTFNSFPNSGVITGHGDTQYIGGGLLAHFDFNPTSTGNFYAEFTARAGQIENDYYSDDLLENERVSFSARTPYFGLHVGTGYKLNIGSSGILDIYAKYFWSHQNSEAVVLSNAQEISFKAVDSHRVRGGARYVHKVNDYISPSIGAAYEHELDGRADASVYGLPIDSPSMKGGTGIGELGLKVKPGADSPFNVDFGVQGYAGKRQGVTGSVALSFDF